MRRVVITLRGNPLYVAVAVAVILFVGIHVHAYVAYAAVGQGMSRASVEAWLGEPARVEDTLIFCAPHFPWTGACPGDAPGTRVRYLFFRKGIDRWIVVGIDEHDRVSFKTVGDT